MSLQTIFQTRDWYSTQQLRQELSCQCPVAPTELPMTTDRPLSICVMVHLAQSNALDRLSHQVFVVATVLQAVLVSEVCQPPPQRKGRRPESIARAR
jgi:hypothetical protein